MRPTASVSAPARAPDREGLFWMSIKDGTDPAAFEAYLKQYPQGTFAALARQRLASVSQPARARDLGRFMAPGTSPSNARRTGLPLAIRDGSSRR